MIVLVGACSERSATPGFSPTSPVDEGATSLVVTGPCGTTADLAVDESEAQIVVSAVWRGTEEGDCDATATIELDDPVGGRDLVDRDAERRWAHVDGAWVSIGWCGVDTRCEDDLAS